MVKSYITLNSDVKEVIKQAVAQKVPIERVEASIFPIRDGVIHQGLVLECDKKQAQVLSCSSCQGNCVSQHLPSQLKTGKIHVALDNIELPENLGTVIRNLSFFGLDKLLLTAKHSADLSPTVSKVSCGAMEERIHDIYRCCRLEETLTSLKSEGFLIIGFTSVDGSLDLNSLHGVVELQGKPVIVVFGNEKHGIRKEILRVCDYKVKIVGSNSSVILDSLNIASASAIGMHFIKSLNSPMMKVES